MISKSVVAATPDLVPASAGAWAGCWFPGLSALGGPASRWAGLVRPNPSSFKSGATQSSAEAARNAILASMKQARLAAPARPTVSAFVLAGMPVYLPVTMDFKSRNKASVIVDAATRTVENLKETISLNPRLSVFIGG